MTSPTVWVDPVSKEMQVQKTSLGKKKSSIFKPEFCILHIDGSKLLLGTIVLDLLLQIASVGSQELAVLTVT